MKLTPKGFTLVELMIVIAIIGILAAALFPSLTSYLARGRDTSRAAGIKEISTGIAGYNVDTSSFPTGSGTCTTAANCCADPVVLAKYIPKFPKDPVASSQITCGQAGGYGYGTGSASGTTTAILSSQFENDKGGNTPTTIITYQGNIVTQTSINTIDAMAKGTGSGYVIRN
jgi:prepilin-type N-terminal cleavage/methylation domain-containing protein